VPVALHPVAGLGLSWFESGEQVSLWPSSGEHRGLSPTPRSSHPAQNHRRRAPGQRNPIAHCHQDRRSPLGQYL